MERPGAQVSLIIPVFRDADMVLECLASITDDPGCDGIDIVVVDDASGDDTPDRIESAGLPGVRLIRRAVNGGFARACSEGWRNRDVNRTIVGVLNADTVVEPGWLKPCLDVLLSDGGCGCVVPSIVDYHTPSVLDSAGQSYAACGWGFRRGHQQHTEDLDNREQIFGPTGCAMLARADVIEECGGLFREDLECYYEDTELAFRLHRFGHETWHVPESRIRHRVSAAYDKIPRRRAYFVSRNSTLLFWTAVPVRLWWSAIPQRSLLSLLLMMKALRQKCLIPFIRGRLEAWPMIVRSGSLRSRAASSLFTRNWLGQKNRSMKVAYARTVRRRDRPYPFKLIDDIKMAWSDPTLTKHKIRQHLRPHYKGRGRCTICDRKTRFKSVNDWYRDNLLCRRCKSIPRERALMKTIDDLYPDWRESSLHESSPGRRGASARLARQCADYTPSQYDPAIQLGEWDPTRRWRNENLEKQTFADESFDLVISQDVMEHVFDIDSAFREIARTLKPGGAHIFTTPLVNGDSSGTRPAARLLEDGSVEYLEPPEYHGNPIDDEGSLVTWKYGYDIVDIIKEATGLETSIVQLDDMELGIKGEYLEVLVTRKPARG
ncbi:MAG: hypothetical protein CMJ40_08525 [Phycisphaerae bacterium]|nr:hypothetical protein [Phycisphaerae bacterium]|tara:strand:- start:2329 stop:4140 length:1812 start_codon:yes stop_codon:yes gene_type:complete